MSTTQPIRSREELQLFKAYYKSVKPNIRNYALIVIGLNSALRISDILHLTYGDVFDFGMKRWRTHLMVKEQKTGKINRIYVNQKARDILEEYTKSLPYSPGTWLFGSQMYKEQPLSRYQAYRIIKEAAAYAGLKKDVSCHSLRKTFGYHAWKQGIQPAVLMNIYNHSAFQITKRYLGIEQDDRDEVFEKIRL